MKISIDNYEIWFLDYLEGRLDQTQREVVDRFLQEHPDLADELEPYPAILLADNKLSFAGKPDLKKTLYDEPEYFESMALASTEGDLSADESIQFENWLKSHSSQRYLVASLKRCKLQPDTMLGFPGKDRLKKRNRIKILWPMVATIAAIFLVAILLYHPETERSNKGTQMRLSKLAPFPTQTPIESKVGNKQITEPLPIAKHSSKTKMKFTPSKTFISTPSKQLAKIEEREIVPVKSMQPKSPVVASDAIVINDLEAIKVQGSRQIAANEIPISDFLQHKLEALKGEEPKSFITREEFTLLGLRLFSRLPGNRLTGKKGRDGRLTSISFNTQLLAFSIPLNR